MEYKFAKIVGSNYKITSEGFNLSGNPIASADHVALGLKVDLLVDPAESIVHIIANYDCDKVLAESAIDDLMESVQNSYKVFKIKSNLVERRGN
ncbi:hypothetical protein CEW46_29240 [Bacillus cereus]|nr:hypothetical protein CEW46_29240 [Bacillus cereus]